MARNFSKSRSLFFLRFLTLILWLAMATFYTFHTWRDDAITLSNCSCPWSVAAEPGLDIVCLYVWQTHSHFGWSICFMLAGSFLCMCRETLAMCNFSGSYKLTIIKSHTLRVSVGVFLSSSCCIYNSWLSDFTALLEFHCVFLNKVAL